MWISSKDSALIEAAYNDASGITERFNKNILSVINRELEADFEVDRFQHVAYFDKSRRRIETYLESQEDQEVRISAINITLSIAKSERIHTEISRKFSAEEVQKMFESSGFELREWYTDSHNYFGLALAVAI